MRGACDPTGRPDPAFSHAIAAVDRGLDAGALLSAATAFHDRVVGEAAAATWYRSYVRAAAAEPPGSLALILAGYVAAFRDLPDPGPSALSLAWTAAGEPPVGHLVFVHADDAPFAVLARAASRLAAVLYRSDLHWTAISTGREPDLSDGLSVRFGPESALGPGEAAATVRALSEIPDDDEAIAREIFGARPVGSARPAGPGWRGLSAEPTGERGGAPARPQATARRAIPPPRMDPIPVALPLMSPPPAPRLGRDPAPRRAPHRITTGVVAACLTLALGAAVYGLLAGGARPAASEPIAPPPPARGARCPGGACACARPGGGRSRSDADSAAGRPDRPRAPERSCPACCSATRRGPVRRPRGEALLLAGTPTGRRRGEINAKAQRRKGAERRRWKSSCLRLLAPLRPCAFALRFGRFSPPCPLASTAPLTGAVLKGGWNGWWWMVIGGSASCRRA